MSDTILNPVEHAARHPIVRSTPAADFFEGAVLGNGGLGAIVCTRPDAVMIHFGHNNVWDIRIAENHRKEIGTFKEVFECVKSVPATAKSLSEDEWCRKYFKMTAENYRKPYPRPFPCGSLVLGFDRRKAEVLGHRVDIATGMCEVRFLMGGGVGVLQVFVAMKTDRLWLRMVDETGNPFPDPFDRVRLLPHPTAGAVGWSEESIVSSNLPAHAVPESLPEGTLSFRQVLPYQEPDLYDKRRGHPKDRAFRLTVRLNKAVELCTRTDTRSGLPETMGDLERGILPSSDFVACVQLDEGLASAVPIETGLLPLPMQRAFEDARDASQEVWHEFWGRSGVALEDEVLERTWYWNLYFLNCSVRAGTTCPGLFANWSYRNIGTAWHGDYHMNCNTQQPFWVTFSSNHMDKNLPYVEMVERALPLARQWAREYYGLRGAYGMHTLYPVEMTTHPYPVPTWGWAICATPWTVQGLWWHYLYTQDKVFLERRAFAPIRDAVLFLVDYMKRPAARGPHWDDDKYHIFPTVPPGLYGLRPGFDKNHDCLADLTLTKFIFSAFLRACKILGRDHAEENLIRDVREVVAHFPAYPTAVSQRGKVFVSVPGENPEIVQNTPNSVMTVFPGEDHGLHSSPDELEIAVNSYRNHRNEGGNDLVFLNLQGARLGLLDLEKFKRQIEYCQLPNGTCTDKCLQAHGRYNDNTGFAFMAPMGIWFENFALPVVINECLLQSYNGTLRFFPNWPRDKRAEFRTLRAVGAFLVSAAIENGVVQWIEIRSEAGTRLKLLLPWERATWRSTMKGEQSCVGPAWEVDTVQGEIIRLAQAVG
ncbi:MAG: hypothetical protein EXS18_06220 [Verrucomicrobiae bacterium]|nr:hypothetical protein [Verrucomicrobiae bacterium]